MDVQRAKRNLRRRRQMRVRKRLRGTGRPRLSVFRSLQHIYAQVIDDAAGRTIVAASTTEERLRSQLKSGGNKTAAAAVGRAIAQRALERGVKQVAFDRGAYRYHGRVAALADAAREAGLEF